MPDARGTMAADEITSMSRRDLSQMLYAVANTKPPPCVRCPEYKRCAEEMLACYEFLEYVNRDQYSRDNIGNPCRQLFTQIMGDDSK